MFHFSRCKNLFRFNNIQAIRIQSLPNLFRKCHCGTNPPSFLLEYLQNSLGFPTERALTVSRKLKGRNAKNPESVLTFLKSHGLSETHIKSIIDRVPSLLCYVSPDSILRPKIQFFKDKGISEPDLVDLMVSNPYLFTYSVEGYIKRMFDILGSVLGTDEFAVRSLIQSKLTLNPDMLCSNLTMLRNCGVQSHHISKLLMKHPRALGVKSDRFNVAVETVKAMGFKPQSNSFANAVFTILGLSSQTWDAKCKVYTSLGWSAEEVLSLFRKQPFCMRMSEEKIRKGVDYFSKELGWGPSYISINPTLLFLSLEKRIIPRHKFLQFLAYKGFIRKDKSFVRSFLISENKFLNNFVIRYESEVPCILKIYEGLIGSNLLNVSDGEDNDGQ